MPKPDYRKLDTDYDFLDHFGHARSRVQRGSPDIPGEDTFFEIRRAIRFPMLEHRRWGSADDPMYPFGAFRRFVIHDAEFPACVQMQVGFRHGRRNYGLSNLTARECIKLIGDCLDTEALVFSKGYTPDAKSPDIERENLRKTSLRQAGRFLAPLYEWATTTPKFRATTRFKPRWVLPGKVSVLLEYREGELASLPANVRMFPLPKESGITLSHLWFAYEGGLYSTWFLGLNAAHDRDLARRLRLCLFGLHAQWESLSLVLTSIADGTLKVKARTEAGDPLQDYLTSALAYISKEKHFGLPQSDLLRQGIGFADIVNPGQREKLLEKLKEIRGNVVRQATTVSAPRENPGLEVFFSYSHKDEKLRDKLEGHLEGLKMDGLISTWYDRQITAGSLWDKEIHSHLDEAQIILLLISTSFIKSAYIRGVELKRAIERQHAGEACVIPVILRPTYWKVPPIKELQALPVDARPVMSWRNTDEALLNIAEGIAAKVIELRSKTNGQLPTLT